MNIDQEKSLEVLTRYWQSYDKRNLEATKVFVGDIHGDFNQFILPLIETETITLLGGIEAVYESTFPEANVYLPKFKINETSVQIYYLGDLVDEGNHSRNVVLMMAKLLKKTKNIHFCFGNHDTNIIGKIDAFRRKPELPLLRSYYTTLVKEMTAYKNVSITDGECYYKSEKNKEFAVQYFAPLLDAYETLFKLGEICYYVDGIVVSHTVITQRTFNDLMKNKARFLRGGAVEKPYLQKDPASLVEVINKAFKKASPEYIAANSLTYNRLEDGKLFEENIVGHTKGGVNRSEKMKINPIPVEFDFERKLHCKPQNGIYYFDLDSSSGYDIDNVSRPDYFFLKDASDMEVSKTNALRLTYELDTNSLKLLIYHGKHKYDGVEEFK